MIPIKDYLQRKSFPFVNSAFIAVNAALFIYQITLPAPASQQLVMEYGFVAGRFLENPLSSGHTLVSSMFLHGGVLHFGGNMLFLFVFGDNVEDAVGNCYTRGVGNPRRLELHRPDP